MVVGRAGLVMLSALALALMPSPLCAQSTESAAQLDPESPMAPMDDIGVPWPDMTAELGDPSETSETTQIAGERRYRAEISGLLAADREAIVTQFDTLSTLKQGEGKPANIAQIDRRAREDAELLGTILRSKGYYDAVVDTEVDNQNGGALIVKLIAEPGKLYTFAEVKVDGLNRAGAKAGELRDAFAVDARDPVDAGDVLASEASLEALIKSEGFPFAKVAESEVVVDHDTGAATLALTVDPGGMRKIGKFAVIGDRPPFDADHVAEIARFSAGDPYDQAMIDDLKRAIVATGLVSSTDVTPVPGATDELADIQVRLEPAPYRTIAGEAGYGSGEGVRAEVSWTHRNLIRPEGAVTFRGVLGSREQYAGAVLRQSNFKDRDHTLNGRIGVSRINRSAYDARTLEIGGSLERQSTIIWQKKWTWSVGGDLLASDERDQTSGSGLARRTYFIGSLPTSLGYDASDNLLDPTRGFRFSIRAAPEISFQSGTFGYVRAQLDGSAYFPAGDKVVIAGRARLGTIIGAGNFSIAPSRRLYAGGGGSVRGYGYQMVGPRDAANDPVGGRSLAEFSLEARIRFGVFGIVPFVDGGNVYANSTPKFDGFRFGAGVGARYHSAFGPIRIDLATPINPRKGDSPVAVYVSLGQAF